MAFVKSYCRFCAASCGTLVEVVDGRIGAVLGNKDHLLSKGFTCPKGRRAGEILQGPHRLTGSLRRGAAGAFEPVGGLAASREIGERLRRIRDEHGPDSIGLFMGTQQAFAALTPFVVKSWLRATGSRKLFSTMTIDQSAKWLVPLRMGEYLGGPQPMTGADVWMLSGNNVLLTASGGDGDGPFVTDPATQIKHARRRGMRLIVIDPRRTETAELADLFLQPRPGTDALLHAGLLRILLDEDLHDAAFCAEYVDGLEELRRAVDPATPERVARECDVPVEDLFLAARMFGGEKRGRFTTGTGVDFGPHSNIAEHLADTVNIVCGRLLREGEPAWGGSVLMPERPASATVAPPRRTWESGFTSRIGGFGRMNGELPSSILPDEILTPGPDRIRALVVSAGNPMVAFPDEAKIRRALEHLELLVVIDPFLTETARLADYVIAPAMSYERADHTVLMEFFFPRPFAAYTPAVVAPPPGVIEDWEFFHETAAVMGLEMKIAGRPLDLRRKPTSEQMLELVASRGRVDMAALRARPDGVLVPGTGAVVGPRGDTTRLQLVPPDVLAEIEAALGDIAQIPAGGFQLISRRVKEAVNSLGRGTPGLAARDYNPAYLAPVDLARLGVPPGGEVVITSAHGSVRAVAEADETLRSGTVALPHGWSGEVFPGVPGKGVNVNVLTSGDEDLQTINRMPRYTAIPVTVVACRTPRIGSLTGSQ
ncbi:molybdopterin-dependent oxidoreductase [Actinomadura geliboluensis]|uniref:molybdopterin-containing oxidoreductase family protein n=1 Tax=Actinomadura geliboluensis TaxID=882440 RepID=UPI00371E9F8B